MKINNIDISNYGAKLVTRTLESSDIENDVEWIEKAYFPFISEHTYYKFKKLILDIEFKGNFKTTNSNKSRLLYQLSNVVITEIGLDPNKLIGTLANHSVKLQNEKYQRVNYELVVIEEMPEQIVTGTTVMNNGTGIAPAKIEITPQRSGEHVLVLNQGTNNEIKIILKNMAIGVTRSISVDGGIFEGSSNKFSDTIIYEYPKLLPGVNKITVTPQASIKTIFKARVI